MHSVRTYFLFILSQSWTLLRLSELTFANTPMTLNYMLPWIGTSIDTLEKCSAAVNDLMLPNGLALNPDKSEVILFGTSRAIASSKIKSVTVAGSHITISDKVNSLGVILDKCLTFDSQVKAMCKAIHYHARFLRHIRRSYLILLQSLLQAPSLPD